MCWWCVLLAKDSYSILKFARHSTLGIVLIIIIIITNTTSLLLYTHHHHHQHHDPLCMCNFLHIWPSLCGLWSFPRPANNFTFWSIWAEIQIQLRLVDLAWLGLILIHGERSIWMECTGTTRRRGPTATLSDLLDVEEKEYETCFLKQLKQSSITFGESDKRCLVPIKGILKDMKHKTWLWNRKGHFLDICKSWTTRAEIFNGLSLIVVSLSSCFPSRTSLSSCLWLLADKTFRSAATITSCSCGNSTQQ